ncbi:hypothetical protein [Nostoc sp. MS1]|nr:hypothetical protein [Nostoc sp. MS1]
MSERNLVSARAKRAATANSTQHSLYQFERRMRQIHSLKALFCLDF